MTDENVTDPTTETTTKETRQDDTPMIVHRVPFTDNNGVQRTKEYGPMPVADYPQWQKDFEAGKVTE